jgi:hypothetical protein
MRKWLNRDELCSSEQKDDTSKFELSTTRRLKNGQVLDRSNAHKNETAVAE